MPRHITRAAAVLVLCPFLAAAGPGGKKYSQTSEVAPSVVRGAELPRQAPSGLEKGPAPFWIWGPNGTVRCALRTTFAGGSVAARLRVTCDNEVVVYLNGKRVAASEEWQQPVEADVQPQLRPGENELVAEVTDQGGAAGLLLKLALTMPDGSVRFVISDGSWQFAPKRGAACTSKARVVGKDGDGPWGDVFHRPIDPRAQRGIFEVPEGFRVERLFTVPRDELGSWVSLTFDPRGRLIVSDQDDKGLCRVTPAPIGGGETRVERLAVKLTAAQGMVWAFGGLYASVNGGPGSGLYRARDTDGDGELDKVEKLKAIEGGGEHGPHGVRLSPDGKSLLLVAGNHTPTPSGFQHSRVPRNWGEDLLLPRQWDANGHAQGILAPGGWIARTDPDGKNWEIWSTGYRNAYDFAFNAEGDLFAYDADMEWDMGMPWYRPTRAVHATSGSEFGWRSGTGKWPTYYPDSLPPLVDIGPGSPVGVTFGYGARFPARYQKALYLLDWTFGTIYALHLEPASSSYRATRTEFLSRTPLPLTDAAVGPDGALYFTIGGRGTHSELFRVTYQGPEPTDPVDPREPRMAEARALRRSLEVYHRRAPDPARAVAECYPYIGHDDRFLRYAARVALEHQPVDLWRDRVLAETAPEALITGAIALARQGAPSTRPALLAALERLDFAHLSEPDKLGLLRAWSLVFIRMGRPDAPTGSRLAAKLDRFYPSGSDPLDRELCNLLVYLESPTVVSKTIALLKRPSAVADESPSSLLARNPGYGGSIAQMLADRPDAQKLHYAFVLRNSRTGWTLEDRKYYFRWLADARTRWNGGASFRGFLRKIDDEAFENASESDRLAVEATGAREPYKPPTLPKPHGPGKNRTLDDVLARTGTAMKGRNFNNGQRTFAAARCIVCHRFGGQGGATGPDLTQAAGRFGIRDLVEAIVAPSKVVSDQYRASIVATDDGRLVTGRILSETPQSLLVLTDPENPTKVAEIPRERVETVKPSPVSLMPQDLLGPLNDDEVLDLLAYLLSRGDARDPMFRK